MLGRYTPGRRANNRRFGVMSPVAMRCGTGYLLTRWRRRRRLCRRCRCLCCGGLRTLPLLLPGATVSLVARDPLGKGRLSPRAGLEVLSVAHWDGVSRSPRKGITKLEETLPQKGRLAFLSIHQVVTDSLVLPSLASTTLRLRGGRLLELRKHQFGSIFTVNA